MTERNSEGSYSVWMGFVYVSNLIVGTGALTMPLAIAKAGLWISIPMLVLLCIFSYMTATSVVEVMASSNAIKKREAKRRGVRNPIYEVNSETHASHESIQSLLDNENHQVRNEIAQVDDDQDPLLPRQESRDAELLNIVERIELGEMSKMYFNKVGRFLFYLVIVVYLFGDLAIYAATVPKSMVSILCNNLTCVENMSLPTSNLSAPCTPGFESEFLSKHSRRDIYHLVMLCFICLLGPFAFFDVSKTKLLQLFTSALRWTSFISMIVLSIIRIAGGHYVTPVGANFAQIPNLFGVAVYSFMCQHSLPALITPINNKNHVTKMLMGDFFVVLLFYLLLSITAAFCFDVTVIQDIYTLNFLLDCKVCPVDFLRYFLALFPVLTLSSSFPIITVTLRNNLKSLFGRENDTGLFSRLFFPVLAMAPPVTLAAFTDDLETLVGITGSYAGAFIQYVIPVALVYCSRRVIKTVFGDLTNKHQLKFNNKATQLILCIWTLVAISFVTYNHVK